MGRLPDMDELASLYIEGSLSHATNLHREAEIDSLLTSTVRPTAPRVTVHGLL